MLCWVYAAFFVFPPNAASNEALKPLIRDVPSKPHTPKYNIKATSGATRWGDLLPWIGPEAIKSKINCLFPALQIQDGGLQTRHPQGIRRAGLPERDSGNHHDFFAFFSESLIARGP